MGDPDSFFFSFSKGLLILFLCKLMFSQQNVSQPSSQLGLRARQNELGPLLRRSMKLHLEENVHSTRRRPFFRACDR